MKLVGTLRSVIPTDSEFSKLVGNKVNLNLGEDKDGT